MCAAPRRHDATNACHSIAIHEKLNCDAAAASRKSRVSTPGHYAASIVFINMGENLIFGEVNSLGNIFESQFGDTKKKLQFGNETKTGNSNCLYKHGIKL